MSKLVKQAAKAIANKKQASIMARDIMDGSRCNCSLGLLKHSVGW